MLRRSLLAPVVGTVLACSVLTGSGSREEPAAAKDATRVVQSAYGEVEIPTEPKRIIADVLTIDYLTALGYDTDDIVGVFGADFYADDEDYYLHDDVARDGLIDPGWTFEANVEKVAAAKPDLILRRAPDRLSASAG